MELRWIVLLATLIIVFHSCDRGISEAGVISQPADPGKGTPAMPEDDRAEDGGLPEESEGDPYDPVIIPSEFSSVVDNVYFTLTPGRMMVYEADKEEGIERIEVIVLDETREVMGVMTRVVWDRVWLDGELIEDTKDWFAQDSEGNVWYFGEESKEMEDGRVVSMEGSWEAGVGGARPGIIMKADPAIGDIYRQEHLSGEAEDMGEVLSVGESVRVPYGSFSGCVKTRDWTPLEPGAEENKYYCPQVGGAVLEIDMEDEERVELVSVDYGHLDSGSAEYIPEQDETQAAEDQVSGGITEDEAKAIAIEEVPGKVTDIGVERKFGMKVYVIEVDAKDGPETDVIVDIETGEVLGTET